jgi:methylaspartate ammonia-lyase
MAKIVDIRLVPVQGAYYYEDIAALQARSLAESERWTAAPATPGFRKAREVAEALSIGITLDSGAVYWGDAVGVSYAGKAGRRGVYRAAEGAREIESLATPWLVGTEVGAFRALADRIDALDLHVASRYGLTQALLRAVAGEGRLTMTEVLCAEWELPIVAGPVPLQGSSGNDRYANADKMIVNRLAALPHSQVDDLAAQLGEEGELLLAYVRWLRARVEELGGLDYRPTLHLDVHGSVAKIFGNDVSAIARYLMALEKEASPYALRMESVFIAPTRAEQIEAFRALKEELEALGSGVKLVADEWANTKEDILEFARAGCVHMIHVKMPDLGAVHRSLEAVLGCRELGVDTLLGGSCIETELSAQVGVHVALACRPDVFLAKPGMGVNEAILITRNEMARALSLLNH